MNTTVTDDKPILSDFDLVIVNRLCERAREHGGHLGLEQMRGFWEQLHAIVSPMQSDPFVDHKTLVGIAWGLTYKGPPFRDEYARGVGIGHEVVRRLGGERVPYHAEMARQIERDKAVTRAADP